jgi:hypothetical protein
MVMLGLIVVFLILTFLGSSTLQTIGFVGLVVMLLLLASNQFSIRFGVLGWQTQGRADTTPQNLLPSRPLIPESAAPSAEDEREQEQAWQREQARYSERRAHEGS